MHVEIEIDPIAAEVVLPLELDAQAGRADEAGVRAAVGPAAGETLRVREAVLARLQRLEVGGGTHARHGGAGAYARRTGHGPGFADGVRAEGAGAFLQVDRDER